MLTFVAINSAFLRLMTPDLHNSAVDKDSCRMYLPSSLLDLLLVWGHLFNYYGAWNLVLISKCVHVWVAHVRVVCVWHI